jgi:hypothetical protein
MFRRRRARREAPIDERAWSASSNVRERDRSVELAGHTPLPAETGPTWAPDRLSVWPIEGGRFGIDAEYHGATGRQRAERQVGRLRTASIAASVRYQPGAGALIRIGPVTHAAAWLALEACLGRPLDD